MGYSKESISSYHVRIIVFTGFQAKKHSLKGWKTCIVIKKSHRLLINFRIPPTRSKSNNFSSAVDGKQVLTKNIKLIGGRGCWCPRNVRSTLGQYFKREQRVHLLQMKAWHS